MDASRFNYGRPIAYRRRQGVTLIELLIVFSILAMVTAAAIPMMLPALEGRRIRETARQINAYLAGARAMAIENGRPAGVLIESFNGLPYSMTLSYVEVPPPYAGDTQNSRAQLVPAGGNTVVLGSDVGWHGCVRCGDLIKFNYQGRNYQLWKPSGTAGQAITSGDTLMIANVDGSPYVPPPMPPSGGVPYQIFRQPVKSAAPSLQLTEGTVIDLACSDVGGVKPTGSPTIMFSSDGAVDMSKNSSNQPMTSYFLIGRPEAMVGLTFASPLSPNLKDQTNLWIAISPQTGEITTAENLGTTFTGPITPGPGGNRGTVLKEARKLVQTGQGMGGR